MNTVTWNDIKAITDAMNDEQRKNPVSIWNGGTIGAIYDIVQLPEDQFRTFAPEWASPTGTGDKVYSKGDYIIRV